MTDLNPNDDDVIWSFTFNRHATIEELAEQLTSAADPDAREVRDARIPAIACIIDVAYADDDNLDDVRSRWSPVAFDIAADLLQMYASDDDPHNIAAPTIVDYLKAIA